jgi:peptidoglycan/xylan/chitin deacetylase (PgdA/CDA1 family)
LTTASFRKFGRWLLIGVLCGSACLGCAGGRRTRVLDNFVLVQAREGDRYSSLADEFLFDASKGWVIADFNLSEKPKPGESLVIPLQPLRKGGLTPDGYQKVPILRYLKFARDPSDAEAVTREAFEAQLKYLQSNGYRVITLQQFLEFVDFKDAIPPKAVVITIDGESRSVTDIALPLLAEYGYPATLFLQPSAIGGRDSLSWTDVHLLAGSGVDIQCRAMTRPPAGESVKPEAFQRYVKELDDEFRESKALLRRKLGKSCSFVAYPAGEVDRLVVALARKHGLKAGLRTGGSSPPFFADPYFIGRASIEGTDDMAAFIKQLDTFQELALP